MAQASNQEGRPQGRPSFARGKAAPEGCADLSEMVKEAGVSADEVISRREFGQHEGNREEPLGMSFS
jgi:hypothetical protein